jgi:hypothetical protein
MPLRHHFHAWRHDVIVSQTMIENLTLPATRPADIAVIIPSTLRSSLARAVRSVFAQDFKGTIQILIGIDHTQNSRDMLQQLGQQAPAHIQLSVFDPGYSTSTRHGGLYSNHYGGALRTILSYAANAPFLAYLDDDDWWARNHLSSLRQVIGEKDWAFSYRWFTDRETGWPICRDEWDSVGPGKGINQQRFGGFVAPSNLFLDKLKCHFVLPNFSLAAFADGTGEDRLVFAALLKNHPWAASLVYSCFYEIPAEVQNHQHHKTEFSRRKIQWVLDRAHIARIDALFQQAGAEPAVKAMATYREILKLNPYHAPSLKGLARALRKTGDHASAQKTQALAHELADAFANSAP